MQADEIKDTNTFETWLNARPDDTRRMEFVAIAHRATLRLLPYALSKWGLRLPVESWLLVALRCAISTRSSLLVQALPDELCLELTSTLYQATVALGDISSRTREDATLSQALRTLAYVIEEVLDERFKGAGLLAIHDSGNSDVYKNLPLSASLWVNISKDAAEISNGKSITGLVNSDLWSLNIVPPEVGQLVGADWAKKLASGSVLVDWYTFVSEGAPIFGIRSKSMRENLERNIALGSTDGKFNKVFWKRDPLEINADITRWVEEARQEDSQIPASDLVDDALKKVENQNPVAPVFLADGSGPIDLDDRQGQSTVSNTRDNQDGHFEVRRLAQAIVSLADTEGASRNNDNQTAYDGASLLLDALGSNLNEIRPALLIPRGEALRQLLLKQFEMDYLAEVPPCSDKVKDALKAWQAAYNPFVALDPELAQRDEAIVGPDAKRVQVIPEEAKSEARLAFDLGAITPVAKAAIDESAAIAPVLPSLENRNSRRLTETAKNLLRAVVVKVQTFVRWVKANPVVSLTVAGAPYAAACWAVRSEEWLMKVFFGHETILSIIRPLLAFLKTLPL